MLSPSLLALLGEPTHTGCPTNSDVTLVFEDLTRVGALKVTPQALSFLSSESPDIFATILACEYLSSPVHRLHVGYQVALVLETFSAMSADESPIAWVLRGFVSIHRVQSLKA